MSKSVMYQGCQVMAGSQLYELLTQKQTPEIVQKAARLYKETHQKHLQSMGMTQEQFDAWEERVRVPHPA